MFEIRVQKHDELILNLKSKGIATGCHYTPLSLQPLFKSYANNCQFIEKVHKKFITLPIHADLTNVEVDYVVAALKQFVSED